MSKKLKKDLAQQMMGAVLGAEDVAKPARNRSSSFTSMLVDMPVGGQPLSRILQIDQTLTLAEVNKDLLSSQREALRNGVSSCISAAKRRSEGSEYSTEVVELLTSSGVYIVAIVKRLA